MKYFFFFSSHLRLALLVAEAEVPDDELRKNRKNKLIRLKDPGCFLGETTSWKLPFSGFLPVPPNPS